MKDLLYRLFEHQYMDRSEAQKVLAGIAAGKYNSEQVSALITVFLMRSISVEELAGFRDALLEMRRPADLSAYEPIDIVGTGGDGKNTFNISTAASFVVAGAGYNVVNTAITAPLRSAARAMSSSVTACGSPTIPTACGPRSTPAASPTCTPRCSIPR